MRWRRVALFASIVVAHVLVVRFFPADPATPHEAAELEIALPMLILAGPVEPQAPRAGPLRQGARGDFGARAPGARTARGQVAGTANELKTPPEQLPAPAPVDWGQEAERVAADRVQRDPADARQAAALDQWRLHVIPAPQVPAASGFAWDYSSTHRLEATPQGMVVRLTDRCSLLINPLAILGGCKVGQMPVHGDLFAHMQAVHKPDEAELR